jgi:hypothetical protein
VVAVRDADVSGGAQGSLGPVAPVGGGARRAGRACSHFATIPPIVLGSDQYGWSIATSVPYPAIVCSAVVLQHRAIMRKKKNKSS